MVGFRVKLKAWHTQKPLRTEFVWQNMLSRRLSVKPGWYYILNRVGKLPILQENCYKYTQHQKTFKNRPKFGAPTKIVLDLVWPPKSFKNCPSINSALDYFTPL